MINNSIEELMSGLYFNFFIIHNCVTLQIVNQLCILHIFSSFDQSVWECNGHFNYWFSNIKMHIVNGKNCIVCIHE